MHAGEPTTYTGSYTHLDVYKRQVLIIVICVYLMVNMLISENASSISMLKVLGYDDRQIKMCIRDRR